VIPRALCPAPIRGIDLSNNFLRRQNAAGHVVWRRRNTHELGSSARVYALRVSSESDFSMKFLALGNSKRAARAIA